jgi:hypothetical protein
LKPHTSFSNRTLLLPFVPISQQKRIPTMTIQSL